MQVKQNKIKPDLPQDCDLNRAMKVVSTAQPQRKGPPKNPTKLHFSHIVGIRTGFPPARRNTWTQNGRCNHPCERKSCAKVVSLHFTSYVCNYIMAPTSQPIQVGSPELLHVD